MSIKWRKYEKRTKTLWCDRQRETIEPPQHTTYHLKAGTVRNEGSKDKDYPGCLVPPYINQSIKQSIREKKTDLPSVRWRSWQWPLTVAQRCDARWCFWCSGWWAMVARMSQTLIDTKLAELWWSNPKKRVFDALTCIRLDAFLYNPSKR